MSVPLKPDLEVQCAGHAVPLCAVPIGKFFQFQDATYQLRKSMPVPYERVPPGWHFCVDDEWCFKSLVGEWAYKLTPNMPCGTRSHVSVEVRSAQRVRMLEIESVKGESFVQT